MLRSIGKAILHTTYRFQRTYIRSRTELPHLLNSRGLLGEGAEVGVKRGAFSEVLLDAWRGRKLYSIDPWKTFSTQDYVDVANVSQEMHDRFHLETVNRLARFGSRSTILRQTSGEAVSQFAEEQLDFVYLDAQHTYEAVLQDLSLWASRVRPGGLLAGHDYLDGTLEEGVFGVKSAVDEFASLHGLRVIVSHDPPWPSWFVFLD